MLSAAIFTLLICRLAPVFAGQVTLGSSHHYKDENQAIVGAQDVTEWNLDKLPNPNDTDHLVFETVYSLLQRWPNTRMRNGHNIVPGVIPKGTVFYRGGNDTELPPGPEWVAMDPEHAYLFCHDGFRRPHPQETCWQLTLATTRPLKVVYFDGSSGVKMPYGSMDIQDLLVWGEALPDAIWEEYQLIEDLCKWGKDFGIDGFVRMEFNFEIMLCDFVSGVSVVSRANLVSFKTTPPYWPLFIPFEIINSGSWHNLFPGETRVQLDLTGLVSFYDSQLVPSLVAVRAGQERWDHRVRDVSGEDLWAVKSRLEKVLIGPPSPSSGIDWRVLIQVVIDRFAARLELTRHLLNVTASDPNELLDFSKKIQTQLRVMLAPYIHSSAMPRDPLDKTDVSWTKPIYKLCATTHADFMEHEVDSMTDSERLLLRAVRGTNREICRVVTKMWAAGVYAGIDSSLNTMEILDGAEVAHVRSKWGNDLDQLMAWLDWSVWVKCEPGCGPEEICYLPTWPYGFPDLPWVDTRASRPSDASRGNKKSMEMSNVPEPGPDDWIRPQPRCLRRSGPYEF